MEDCALLDMFGALEFICGSGLLHLCIAEQFPRRSLHENCAILFRCRSLAAIHLPRLSKTEQIVAVTSAMLSLRVGAIVLHETIRKSFVATRTFGSITFLKIFTNRLKEVHEIIDEMRTSRLQLCTC